MIECGIQIAKQPNQWVFVFQGDVRLSLCTTLDELIDSVFSEETPSELAIDLSQAANIDSTCLGLLAKLALHFHKTVGVLPGLHCPSQDLVELIESLGLESLFEWHDDAPMAAGQSVALKACDAQAAQPVILQAHETLSQLNDANQAEFHGLIHALKDRS